MNFILKNDATHETAFSKHLIIMHVFILLVFLNWTDKKDASIEISFFLL